VGRVLAADGGAVDKQAGRAEYAVERWASADRSEQLADRAGLDRFLLATGRRPRPSPIPHRHHAPIMPRPPARRRTPLQPPIALARHQPQVQRLEARIARLTASGVGVTLRSTVAEGR
jgi:hypothetical protein